MPRPTSATTLARPRLAKLTYEYMTQQSDFIGTQILPIFPVQEQNGEWPRIPTEALLQAPDTKRAPRAPYNRGDFQFETDNYSCSENGWEEVVDVTESKLYSNYFDAEAVASKRAAMIILRNQDIRIASKLFNATTFSGRTTGVTVEWNTYATATPASDVKLAKDAVYAATGVEANALVVSRKVRDNLNFCASIIDRIKYTNPNVDMANLDDALIARALGVERLIVGRGRKNTAIQGQAAVLADIWDDEYALVCRVESGQDIAVPSVGRTFLWTADSPTNLVVESYMEDQTRGTVIRARQYTDEKVMYAAAGYLLSNITT